MRKLLVFIISVTMLVGGLYWAVLDLESHLYGRPLVYMLLAGILPASLGAYLLWADFIAPVLGIKTGEEKGACAETYAQRLYDGLPAKNDLGDITASRLRIPTALHQKYQHKIIVQRELICFAALISVATPQSKLQPVVEAFGNLLFSKARRRGVQGTRDQLAEYALKDVKAMFKDPFAWGQRWLADFRSDPKDNHMVVLFADHCCRLFQAYKHSIESTQPK
jgi:hypothetical protein